MRRFQSVCVLDQATRNVWLKTNLAAAMGIRMSCDKD